MRHVSLRYVAAVWVRVTPQQLWWYSGLQSAHCASECSNLT